MVEKLRAVVNFAEPMRMIKRRYLNEWYGEGGNGAMMKGSVK